MVVDLPRLLIGLLFFVLIGAWTLSDWRVRSMRSVGILLAGLAVVVASGLFFDWPFDLLGVGLGVLLCLPVILRHPSVAPFASDDAETIRRIRDIESDLVRAGQRLRRNPDSLKDYARNIESARRKLRRVVAPDEEWKALLSKLDAEISGTLSVATGQGRHADFREQRAAFRAQYRSLIQRRLNFWR